MSHSIQQLLISNLLNSHLYKGITNRKRFEVLVFYKFHFNYIYIKVQFVKYGYITRLV